MKKCKNLKNFHDFEIKHYFGYSSWIFKKKLIDLKNVGGFVLKQSQHLKKFVHFKIFMHLKDNHGFKKGSWISKN